MNKKATNPADKIIGGRIRLRRTQLGMSQEKLADALGLTFQQVQKYEKGMNRVTAGRLVEVAEILGVPVSFFFEGLASSPTSSTEVSDLQALLLSNDGSELARAFLKIESPAMRRALVDIARAAAGS